MSDEKTITVEATYVPDAVIVKTWTDKGKPCSDVRFVREPGSEEE